MKNKKFRIANYAIAIFHILLAGILYPSLPQQIPMNWGFNGTVSYSDKHQLFFLCGMALFMAFLFDILPKIDPRNKNYVKFGSYYDYFCIFMQIFLLIMTGIILMESFRPGSLSVPMIVMILTGILFVFLGNVMPKIKSNFYMGFKTPWTLSSEEVWYKTHRLGGKCFFLAGILMIALSFLANEKISFWLIMGAILIASALPMVMSYVWWKQEQKDAD